MKLRLLALLLIPVLFVAGLTGCDNEKTDTAGEATAEAAAEKTVSLTCFYEGLSVRDEPGGEWVTTLSFGDKVEFLGEEQTDANNSVFYKVKTESGETGWSSSYYLVEDGVPAVVITEDKIYNEPEPKGVTTDTLPPAYLVCISPTDDGEKYAEINYLHPESGYVQLGKYMKKESISTAGDDVDAAVLLFLGRAAYKKDNEEAAVTYLETALEEFPSSALQPVIARELIDYQQKDGQAQEIVPLESRITGIINSPTVNVRKTPSLKADVIASVGKDTRVSLSKRTTVKEEIKGFSDYWYLADFADGQQGWVYGALISMEE